MSTDSTRRIELYIQGDRIIMEVEHMDGYIVLDAQTASLIMDTLHEMAVELGMRERAVQPGGVISDSLRQTMVTRAAHIIHDMDGKPDAYAAVHVVDAVLGLLP